MRMQSLITAAMRVRFALWAIEMALPSTLSLKRRMRSGLIGLVLVMAGAALLTLITGAALILLAFYLHYYSGYSLGLVVLGVAGLSLSLILMLFAAGKARVSEAFGVNIGLSGDINPTENSQQEDDIVKDIIHGFLQGIFTPPPAAEDSTTRPQNPETRTL